MPAGRWAVAWFCLALAGVLPPVGTAAQDVSGPNLTAAFIYRFAHFTEWPAGTLATGSPLTMCVVGDAAVRDALERTVTGVTVAGRSVIVAFGASARPRADCHILYVSGVPSALAARIVSDVREVPVLTVSDLEGFNKMGGIAEYFYDAGQLRFSIELDAMTRSRLQLSSRLLQLARPRR
jgi:hypothetical protein